MEQGLALVDEILEGMEAMGTGSTRSTNWSSFRAGLCVLRCWASMNKALFWLNKVLNDNEPTLRQDIFTYARLFNLVLHYELGNFDLLEYIVRSTQRFLSKRHRAYQVENTLMEGQEAGPARIPCTKRELFRSCVTKLKELFKDPNEGLVLKYFDVMAWVEGHVVFILPRWSAFSESGAQGPERRAFP
jgi:hypothetical protein